MTAAPGEFAAKPSRAASGSGPLGETLYVMPPLAITLDELGELMQVLTESIDAVTAD